MTSATLTRPAASPARPASSATAGPEGKPARGKASELEGYRGIAALSIVVFHVCQYVIQTTSPHGFLGQLSKFEIVDILFVLSAYLLTLSYARSAIDQTSAMSAKTFLFRRAVRILPLYWIGVTAVWSMRNSSFPGDWRDLLEHLTFTQVFDTKRIFYTLGPTWSMSLEIMFYGLLVVLAPLAVKVCAGIESRRKRVALLLGGCGVLLAIPVIWNATAFFVFHVPFDHWPVYFGPQARFAAFAAGMALAVMVAARRSKPVFTGVWPTVLRLGAVAVIVVATALDRNGSYGQAAYHDFAAIGWMMMLASTVLGSSGQSWARALSWRPLTLVGLISYSTYMWHEPIMQFLQNHGLTSRTPAGLPWSLLAVLTLSVLAGIASYWLIEQPTSKLRSLRGRDGGRRNYYPELAD